MCKPGAAAVLVVVIALIAAASLAAESQPFTLPLESDSVPRIAAITMRDGSGRAQRFTDLRNREFAIERDTRQRVQSIEATRGPHFSDILSIGYAPDGQVIGVRFRRGYALFLATHPDGSQLIRDSRGVALRRVGRTIQPMDVASAEDAAALGTVITEIESLLSSLGQPTQ